MGHWYTRSGETLYQIKKQNSEELRDTTLRDAKKLKLLPSVTTIMGSIAKPGLLRWQMEQVLVAVQNQKLWGVDEPFDSYASRILLEANRVGKEAAIRGDHLHNKLEEYFKNPNIELDDMDVPYLDPVIEAVENIAQDGWESERSFGHFLGFGGKVDLSKRHLQFKNKGIIIDFKTKNTADIKKFHKYDDHVIQLAAYRMGLGLLKADCYNIYFSSLEPGIIEVHKWSEEELERGWVMFSALLNYWTAANNYDPRFLGELIDE